MSYPELYKRSATGALLFWAIDVENSTIVTCWGQVGGATQTTSDCITEGKNIGRANATTPSQQAEAEAEARWTKRLKDGYCQTPEAALAGEADALVLGGVLPMLAHKYAEQADKIRWPAYVQPKLDGHRCIGVVEGGKATLWSRKRRPINSMPHIARALEALGTDGVFDGELYSHAYHDRFEDLTSFIRSAEPRTGHEALQYHIYDTVTPGTFEERHTVLSTLPLALPLVRVETWEVSGPQDLSEAFQAYRAAGYEGCMVRNVDGRYVHRRSLDLQKVKAFDSSEFVVVGVKGGRGKLARHAIFVCAAGKGEGVDGGSDTFDVKLSGDTDVLKTYFDDPSLAVGRLLEVRHQGLTAKGLPRGPVGLRFRDDLSPQGDS